MFLNLRAGLDRIGVPYRVNDYRYARRHPDEVACVVGQAFVLDKMNWENPIVFGAAVFSHPIEDPLLLQRLPVKRVLVPGPWMKRMCEPAWGDAVEAWPVGIDTDLWNSGPESEKTIDVLLYDKVMWDREENEEALIAPIRATLKQQGLSLHEIRYGAYREGEYRALLSQSRAMVFLCEHETQGIAYQEALSCGVPIFAWDRGGPWRDPYYYPHRVVFEPVTSVPYWDDRCGMRFESRERFEELWPEFWRKVRAGAFRPRDYVLEHLSLEQCARDYANIVRGVAESLNGFSP
jgi:hypothetical protein